jgi:hypothetical protein
MMPPTRNLKLISGAFVFLHSSSLLHAPLSPIRKMIEMKIKYLIIHYWFKGFKPKSYSIPIKDQNHGICFVKGMEIPIG